MKTILLAILLLISPLIFFAQTLTGLWVGTVSNDSTTIRKDQSFEIVLTQYKDKVYGYSRSAFIVNDSLYYIVKRVKGTIEGDICEVKDDDIISHNFPHKPDKGVKMISTFRRNQQDSVWRLDGNWKTTESKKHGYYSVSGKIDLKTETDFEKSKIFPHLEELSLADDVAFYKESKKPPVLVAAIKQPLKDNKKEIVAKVEERPAIKIKDSLASTSMKSEPIAVTKPAVKNDNKEKNATGATPSAVASKEIKKEADLNPPAKTEPVAVTQQRPNDPGKSGSNIKEEKIAAVAVKDSKKEPVIKEDKPAVVTTKEIKQEEKKTPVKEEIKKQEPVETKKDIAAVKENAIVKQQETTAAPVKEKELIAATRPEVKPATFNAATMVAERKVTPPQTVFFRSDSLELSLYDNGEVDGDTVSVLLNGQIILARQGLKASAIKKTIYIPAGNDNDSLTLVLYAENLGKYPPNTGLLVVHDGEDVYQIRFSADLQQNAAVIFKRKKK
jgi:hypothetical protein